MKYRKRFLSCILATMLIMSHVAVLPIAADDSISVRAAGITQIVFGEIFSPNDKGNTYNGNLYVVTTLGPAYFDGVRNGDTFEFQINVEKAGDYHFCFSFGWVEATGTYDVSVDGGAPIHLQNTIKGLGWRDWIDSSEGKMTLSAGVHTIRITMRCDGPNLYSMKLAPMDVSLSQGATNHRVELYDGTTNRSAEQIDQNAAVQFNSTIPFAGISLSSASWNNNIGSIRMSLFKWDTSYDKTLNGSPIATEDFVDFEDNLTLKFLFDEVTAGEYLLYMENITGNPAESVGYWGHAAAQANVRAYRNNAIHDFCPGLSLLCGEDVASPLAPISEMDPGAAEITPTEADMYPNGNMSEYKMNRDSLYGVQFCATTAFGGCEVYIPTVPMGSNTLTLALYKWNGNYSETVKSSPVAEKTLTDVKRNNWASLTGDFSAGEYLFVIKNGTVGMTLAVVEAASTQANHYLHTAQAGVSVMARLIGDTSLSAPSVPTAQDFISGDASSWVGTDGLDRDLTTYEESGGIREGKYVGIFYHTWHSAFAYRDVVNVTQFLQQYPDAVHDYNHPAWEGRTNCFWNEPIYGYYNNGIDRYVLRKQAELLADAGVDVVFFDNTNGTMNFVDAILTLCEVWAEARADGVKTPQISAMLNMYDYTAAATQITELYNEIYSKGLYQDLWFYWEGKPLLLGYPEMLKSTAEGREIYKFFSYRPINPSYNEDQELIKESDVSTRVTFNPPSGFKAFTQWKWISVYPQEKMYLKGTDQVEQMCVCVAQNWSDKQGLTAMNAGDMVFGRGYTDKYGINTSDEAAMAGLNFAEQWEYALEVDPTFIFITGWNEWQVGRAEESWGLTNAFPDNATDGYSRDIEPSTGMLKDHFYNQMVSYIRKFKGVAKQEAASPAVTNPTSIDWSAVTPVYRTYANNTVSRDYDGYQGYHYENTTGRNDFVESRVAYDAENLYFMVKTAEAITPYTDPAWMRLLIDVAGVDGESWETFEYILNRETPTAEKAILEKSKGGWSWEKVAEVAYTVEGDTMVVTIPRTALGIDTDDFTVNFKWSDNMQTDGDIMDFYVNGDVAPGARFKYSFTSLQSIAGEEETTEEAESTTDTDEVTSSEATTEAYPEATTPATTETSPESLPNETDVTTTAATSVEDSTAQEPSTAESNGCKSTLSATGILAVATAASAVALARKKKETED